MKVSYHGILLILAFSVLLGVIRINHPVEATAFDPSARTTTPKTTNQVLTLKIGLYENAPKIYTDERGQAAGFWPDLLRYIAAEENWEIVWISGTWDEGLERLEKGEIDIMPDVAWTETRSTRFDFSQESVLLSWSRLYARQGSDIQSILDLEGKTVAALESSVQIDDVESLKDLIEEFQIECTLIEFENYTQIFEALENGEINAGITNKDYGNRHEGDYNIERTSIIFQPVRLLFAFPKVAQLTPYLIRRIDDHVRTLKADNDSRYYQILEEHIGGKVTETFIETIPGWVKNVLKLSLGIIVFLLGVGVVSRIQVRRKTSNLRDTATALQESQARYQDLYENAPNAYFSVSADGYIIRCNRRAGELLGYKADELIGRSVLSLYADTPGGKEKAARVLEGFRAGDVIRNQELQMQRADGTPVWVNLTINALRDKFDKVIKSRLILTEITASKQLEKALENAAAEWRITFDAVEDAICLLNADQKILRCNWAMSNLVQKDFDDIIGRHCWEIVHGTSKPIPDCPMSKVRSTLQRESMELFLDGKWLDITVDPILDDDRKLSGVVHIIRDITERVRIEEALREREARYRAATGHPDLVLAQADRDLRYAWIRNPNLDFDPTGVIGRRDDELDDNEGTRQLVQLKRDVINTGSSLRREITFPLSEGPRTYAFVAEPVRDDAGRVTGVATAALDITERRRREEDIRRQANSLAALLKISNIFASTLELNTVLQTTTDGVVELSDLDSAAIYLLEGKTLRLGATTPPLPPDLPDSYQRTPLSDHPHIQKTLSTRKPMILPDTQTADLPPAERQISEMRNLRSILYLPIIVGKKVMGTLIVASCDEPREIRPLEVELCNTLANQTAVAIGNARLFKETKQRTRQLESLHQASLAFSQLQTPQEVGERILNTLEKMLAYRRGAIAVYDEAGDELQLLAHARMGLDDEAFQAEMERVRGFFRQGKGITRWVAEHGEALRIGDVDSDPRYLDADSQIRSEMAVPLQIGGRTIGAINVESEQPNAFSEDDQRVLTTLANQAAVAIENARLYEQLKVQTEQLRSLTIRMTEVEEAERRQLARELHDRVGQNLTALSINLNMVRNLVPAKESAQLENHLKDSQELLEETAAHIRDVMNDLRPPELDVYGLGAALRGYARQFSKRTGIDVQVNVGETEAPWRLSPNKEIALFRVAQEALTNVSKHAEASQIIITMAPIEGGYRLIIADDGKGFHTQEVKTPKRKQGWGLLTMRERIESVGGTLQINAIPSKGTEVIVEIDRERE